MNNLEHAVAFARARDAVAQQNQRSYKEIYEENRHRVYALAFWITENELEAESLMTKAFARVLLESEFPTPEEIDRALIAEGRTDVPLGVLTLRCAPAAKVLSVRRNILRVNLEQAVRQLPNLERMIFVMHDVEGYDHGRITRTLELSEEATRRGLYQARLRVRELLAK